MVTFFDSTDELSVYLQKLSTNYSNVFVLADSNTAHYCLPKLSFTYTKLITIEAGEEHKSIDNLQHIWTELLSANAGRNDVLVSVGGGMITDIGGFAASTYKRGIAHVLVPSSLLSMVDASVGGKTAIDFMGVKNVLGTFRAHDETLICSMFLETLPQREKRAAFGEILKHYLISEQNPPFERNFARSISLDDIKKAIAIKQSYTLQDPFDKGIRKSLNFGHTIGHALESHSLTTSNPLLHGEAVALGMIAESQISHAKGMISTTQLNQICDWILLHFSDLVPIVEDDFSAVFQYMKQDKKNDKAIHAVLLNGFGDCVWDVPINEEEVKAALLFINEKIQK